MRARTHAPVQLKCDQPAGGKAVQPPRRVVFERHGAAKAQDEHAGEQIQVVGQRQRQRAAARVADAAGQRAARALLVLSALLILRGHHANRANVGQRLRGGRVALAQRSRDVPVQRARPGGVQLRDVGCRRERGDGKQRQLPGLQEARDDGAHQQRAALHHAAEQRLDGAQHVVHVVRKPRRQVARGSGVEEGDVLRQQRAQQAVAHVKRQSATHEVEAQGAQAAESPGRHAVGNQHGHVAAERRRVAAPHSVQDAALIMGQRQRCCCCRSQARHRRSEQRTLRARQRQRAQEVGRRRCL